MSRPKGPVLFDLDEDSHRATPSEAPPVPDPELPPPPEGSAMQTIAALAARRPSRLARLFWGLLGSILTLAISLAAWNFATGLMASVPVLGYVVSGLLIALVVVVVVIALREVAAFARLGRIDALHRAADTALGDDDLPAARRLTDDLVKLYAGREDTRWGRERLAERRGDQFDAHTLLALTRLSFWCHSTPPPCARSRAPRARSPPSPRWCRWRWPMSSSHSAPTCG